MDTDEKYLVAGASGLIGKEMVRALLANGNHVLAVDKSIEVLKRDLAKPVDSQQLKCVEIDLTNEGQFVEWLLQVPNVVGAINFAYPRNEKYGDKLPSVGLSAFNENVNLILGSSYNFMRSCFDYFCQFENKISVVNLSSIYGVVPPDFSIYEGTSMTMPVEYAASKSAVLHLTRYFANFVSHPNFRINCVSPGGLENGQDPVFVQNYNEKTYGNGLLAAHDVVNVCQFLLSEESNAINGQNIIVDAGFVNK